jgi:DNA-binding response OmpR family regulator
MTHEQHPDTILVVGAERDERTFLADNLTADGYDVLEAGSAQAARCLLEQSFVDLMIVDQELPDDDGLELVRLVRESAPVAARVDPNVPVILTSRGASVLERVRGLERGCDDYLPKPYDYAEILARARALLRRRGRPAATARLRVGVLEVDALARQAWVGGRPILLSSKEFSLLYALACEPSRVFRRAELMQTIWGWSDGGHAAQRTRTLDSHVFRLRRKLSRAGANYIVNVWGVGYRLVDMPATLPAAAQQLVA